MKQTLIIIFVSLCNITIAQNNVGINTNSPTETLDVNGTSRFRNTPNNGHPVYIMGLDVNGKAYRTPYDSLKSNSGAPAELVAVDFISGDTITEGNFVAVGDGLSGVMRVNTYTFPYTNLSFPNTQTCYAQIFTTTSKVIAIKSVVVDFEMQEVGVPTILTCAIRAVSGGIPVGSNINGQVATADGAAGTAYHPAALARFVFNPPIIVNPNSTYAAIIKLGSSVGQSSTWLHAQSLGMYSGGYRCSSTDGGVTWIAQMNEDINCFIYETQTESGKIYRTDLALNGLIGSNTTSSCLDANGCPSTFYGQNDQRDNPIGVAMNGALPGQTVTVQMMGHTDLITGFSPGKRLYLTSPPGSVGTTGSKLVGVSTGNGAVIQIDY